jgi:hypothetical protein
MFLYYFIITNGKIIYFYSFLQKKSNILWKKLAILCREKRYLQKMIHL